eukprot:m.91737 g.91737  ORF g.91737 m.91737 type:complete len:149 (-) comp12958_c0_seq4:1817-2263(-)
MARATLRSNRMLLQLHCVRYASNLGRVSTPHPITSLRKVELHVPGNETQAEERLRKQLDEDFEFHHNFWLKNNAQFKEERKVFMKQYRQETGEKQPPPEVLSQFYRQFLQSHHQAHIDYNKEHWKRQFVQIPLYFMAYVTRMFAPKST